MEDSRPVLGAAILEDSVPPTRPSSCCPVERPTFSTRLRTLKIQNRRARRLTGNPNWEPGLKAAANKFKTHV